jgi:hypothetical protein
MWQRAEFGGLGRCSVRQPKGYPRLKNPSHGNVILVTCVCGLGSNKAIEVLATTNNVVIDNVTIARLCGLGDYQHLD